MVILLKDEYLSKYTNNPKDNLSDTYTADFFEDLRRILTLHIRVLVSDNF